MGEGGGVGRPMISIVLEFPLKKKKTDLLWKEDCSPPKKKKKKKKSLILRPSATCFPEKKMKINKIILILQISIKWHNLTVKTIQLSSDVGIVQVHLIPSSSLLTG